MAVNSYFLLISYVFRVPFRNLSFKDFNFGLSYSATSNSFVYNKCSESSRERNIRTGVTAAL
jgi:hypothetical protein